MSPLLEAADARRPHPADPDHQGPYWLGAQNDGLFVLQGSRPGVSNDDPDHDADRQVVCRVFDTAVGYRVVAAMNRDFRQEMERAGFPIRTPTSPQAEGSGAREHAPECLTIPCTECDGVGRVWVDGSPVAEVKAEPVARDWTVVEKAIDEYVEGYGLEADEGYHDPTDDERFMIRDAIMGLLVYEDFLSAFEVGTHWIAADDYYRNVKALDVALNGEGGATRPLLIDVLSQVEAEVRKRGRPLLASSDAEDAERWRTALRHVGATRLAWHLHFTFALQPPLNVMQGSVAEHFTKCIDAARNAPQAQGEG